MAMAHGAGSSTHEQRERHGRRLGAQPLQLAGLLRGPGGRLAGAGGCEDQEGDLQGLFPEGRETAVAKLEKLSRLFPQCTAFTQSIFPCDSPSAHRHKKQQHKDQQRQKEKSRSRRNKL